MLALFFRRAATKQQLYARTISPATSHLICSFIKIASLSEFLSHWFEQSQFHSWWQTRNETATINNIFRTASVDTKESEQLLLVSHRDNILNNEDRSELSAPMTLSNFFLLCKTADFHLTTIFLEFVKSFPPRRQVSRGYNWRDTCSAGLRLHYFVMW